jgi:hypothetical protein
LPVVKEPPEGAINVGKVSLIFSRESSLYVCDLVVQGTDLPVRLGSMPAKCLATHPELKEAFVDLMNKCFQIIAEEALGRFHVVGPVRQE